MSGRAGSTAERFAARVRARRRRRVAVGAGVVVLLLALGWSAVLAPWATVRRIEVRGVSRVDAGTVQDAAGSQLGRPLLLADTAAVAARVRADRLVRSARVTRSWPGGLRITVVERVAVAAVPGPDDPADLAGRFSLVDADGVELARAEAAPAGLPVVQTDLGKAGAAALQACLRVLGDLPAPVSRQVRQVGAGSADGVWFVLADGRKVTWGSAEQDARKAEVLTALLRQPGRAYDVSAPDSPAVVARG
jgi:cell division protein FtsQ